MTQTIFEAFNAGFISVEQAADLIEDALRDVIDVEYEDLSHELNENQPLPVALADRINMQAEYDVDLESPFSVNFKKFKF